MKTPTIRDIIQTKGVLLTSYYSDLCYFDRLQKLKKGIIDIQEYIDPKAPHSFRMFLAEFRVARNTNVRDNKTKDLLELTLKWCTSVQNCLDVEGFKNAMRKKELVHDKGMTSLASKILFLNSPTKVIPYDSLAKTAVGYEGTNYNEYIIYVKRYAVKHSAVIQKITSESNGDLNKIEQVFASSEKRHLFLNNTIRKNRILDKLLWTVGKSYR